MTEIEQANERVSKPLHRGKAYVVRTYDENRKWTEHPECDYHRAMLLVRRLKAATAIRLVMEARGITGREDLVAKAQEEASRYRESWRRVAKRIIREDLKG